MLPVVGSLVLVASVTTLAACARPPAPPSSVVVAPASADALATPPSPPRPLELLPVDAFPLHPDDASWALALPRDVNYSEVALDGVGPLAIEWHVLPTRRLHDVPPEHDYPGNYASELALLLRRGEAARTIALGLHAGSPSSLGLSSCQRRLPETDRQVSALPNMASTFSVEIMQGSSDFMLVRGRAGALHLLHRETHDGACPVMVRQGPLETCADMTWEALASITTDATVAVETVVFADEDGKTEPFDCRHAHP